MTSKNPEYDFKWCPGCGDFGVRRALEFATVNRLEQTGLPMESNVVVAGIGCSGNLVHLLQGPQPYGFHGIHGRTLPISMGVKMARPDLNVIIVAGDGDFLSIGAEHIGPQAARNLDVCAIIMDNGVYGLTKGQRSPTTEAGNTANTTPYGKSEDGMNPLDLYLTLGVSFIASAFSSQVKELGRLICLGMEHRGFSIVHVQSPCTTYNDTYEQIKGSPKKGIQPLAYTIPIDHDPTDRDKAYRIIRSPGLPLGLIYREERLSFNQRMDQTHQKASSKSIQELLDSFAL